VLRRGVAGGAVHGVGIALQEALRFDAAGQPLVTSFMDYLPPGAVEAPELRVAVLEHGTAQNPLGVKGTGEAGVIGVGAAIANAVADATGRGPTKLPLEV
jgi:CO/xanthine dehydrogenase Mo-binding subunit